MLELNRLTWNSFHHLEHNPFPRRFLSGIWIALIYILWILNFPALTGLFKFFKELIKCIKLSVCSRAPLFAFYWMYFTFSWWQTHIHNDSETSTTDGNCRGQICWSEEFQSSKRTNSRLRGSSGPNLKEPSTNGIEKRSWFPWCPSYQFLQVRP